MLMEIVFGNSEILGNSPADFHEPLNPTQTLNLKGQHHPPLNPKPLNRNRKWWTQTPKFLFAVFSLFGQFHAPSPTSGVGGWVGVVLAYCNVRHVPHKTMSAQNVLTLPLATSATEVETQPWSNGGRL